MSGEVLRIGPFIGGLNLASDISSVADEELTICLNMELDIDGSLKNRPAFNKATTTAPAGHKIIGTAVFSGVGYLFSSGVSGGTESIHFSTNGTTWTQISTGRYSLISVQYRDKVWFPAAPGSTGEAINWDPVGGVTNITDTDMPRASHAVVHKERLYVVPGMTATTNTSRLSFSDPAQLQNWTGTNFIDVSPGDGETLNAVIVYNDNLLLFKNNSVFVLAYDLNPADAILREINPVLGAPDGDNVIQFENVVYAQHRDTVYEIVNYDFNPINVKVPFVLNTTVPSGLTRLVDSCISIVGERLVIKYFARMYVFGLRTRTWSEWSVTAEAIEIWHDTTRFWQLPNTDNYYSRRSYTTATDVIKVPENPTVVDVELDGGIDDTVNCIVRSKDFDMADPVHFKRLFWWSADLITGNEITGRTSPVTYTFSPIWNSLDDSAWDDLGTWDNPLVVPTSTDTIIDQDNNFSLAKTVKFNKSLRFRKINFEVELQTNGTSLETGKLFSLTATVLTKQGIVQKVS